MVPGTVRVDEAAKMMGIHPDTVLSMIRENRIPAGKIGKAYIMLYTDIMGICTRAIAQQTAERMGPGPIRRRRKA